MIEIAEVLLNEMIDYVTETTVRFDLEFGLGRTFEEIVDDEDAPELYWSLMELKEDS